LCDHELKFFTRTTQKGEEKKMSANYNEYSLGLRYRGIAKVTAKVMTISLIFATFSGPVAAQTDEDSASVYEFVEAYQHTFGTRDPVALAEFFTEDADFLMFNLPEIRGREAIENVWRSYWRSKFNKQEPERKGKFILNSLRFFSIDVALVNIESITGGRDSLGVELQTRKARGTWLLHRKNSRWLISALCGMPTEKDSVVLVASVKTTESLRPHIRAFVDAYEDAYDSHDASAVTAFFRNDADIILRNQPLVHGTQAIQEWWSSYFSTPRNFKIIMIIDKIRTITNDVVQVNLTVTGAIPGTEGKLQPLRHTSALWILVRGTEGWRIAAMRVLPGKDDVVIRR
jgi:uncharacterized protein (TIGR02246 family)